jgi:hypothetical protein
VRDVVLLVAGEVDDVLSGLRLRPGCRALPMGLRPGIAGDGRASGGHRVEGSGRAGEQRAPGNG